MSNTDFNPDQSADFGGTSPSTVSPTAPAGSSSTPAANVPLSQQWTKLGIINEALTNTANNTLVLPDDSGTDEYRVASSAYDQWLSLTVYRRDWTFASQITALSRLGDSNWPGYADIYAKPLDCMFLETCWRGDLASLVQPAFYGAPNEQYDTLPPPLDYAIFGDQIHTTATWPAQTEGDANEDFNDDFAQQAALYCKYVPFPTLKTAFSVGFVAALRLKIEAALYRGLNEDATMAAWAEKESEAALQEAATRNDQETPRKVAFRSRLIEARRRGRYGGYWR